ncbi:uncharacterized protein LOC133182811 [Saccostrea echinata]|uniref:uncharacterized protein LOC133182811 n=1 Tax=Saccostrea echinata TaxID=191078 RepID=UPI002A824C1A|nr:uncharacterized protein LOC133182811 [Saccostrea echinata]
MKRGKDVRILILLFFAVGVGVRGVSVTLDDLTSRYLCASQCLTFSSDSPNIYSQYSAYCAQPNPQFSYGCQSQGCAGSCNSLILIIHDIRKSASIPSLSAHYVTGTDIQITWSSPATPYYTRYLLQIKSYRQWISIAEITTTSYRYHNPNPCNNITFRVIAVNQYGTKGFSSAWTAIAPKPPSAPQNAQLMFGAMSYNPGSKEFAGILQVEGIQDWKAEDIEYYQWSTQPTAYCRNMNSLVLPIFDPLASTDAIRAVSKCGVPGPYNNITIDLSVDPPGVVENVTLRMDMNHPQIWLKVQWKKPSDLGSMGVINHYLMRWGKVIIPPFFLDQPQYTHEPLNTTLDSNIVEFGIQVNDEPNAVYGFQIIPIAPTQIVQPFDYDKFQVFAITLKNRTSCQNTNMQGSRISCDEDGVSIIQFSNTLDITYVWRVPSHSNVQVFDDEEFHDKYAIQLGEVVHSPPPVGQQLTNTNVTVVESVCEEQETVEKNKYTLCAAERDSVVFRNLEPEVMYGVRVIGLKDSEPLPTEKRWRMMKIHTFTLNETTEEVNATSSTEILKDHRDELIAIAVVLSVVLFVVLLVLCYTLKRNKQRKMSSLDNHLLFGDSNPNNAYSQIERAMLTATTLTVVADKWEIPHNCVRIGRMLGSGAFGYVLKGRVSRSILQHRGITIPFDPVKKKTYVPVAVKLMQEGSSETKREEFLKEIRIMKGIGYHKNIISMLGCCTLNDPICLIVEHAAKGDMLSYLRNIRQNIQKSNDNAQYVNQEIETVGPQELLSFARQISTGMEFLSQKGYIHRDLAARNILVDKNNLVKIGDFGLTRYTLDNKVYVNRKGGRLPLKWMSIEAINELTFSSASDVWSFGILLFEIVTLGGTPYPTIDMRDLLLELKNGYRMERPDNCSEEIYQIMRSCWREDPNSRPSFTELCRTFDSMLETSCGEHYINFELDDSKIYYQVHDILNSQNTTTASIPPAELDCFDKLDKTNETDINTEDIVNYNVTSHVEDACSTKEQIPRNKCSLNDDGEVHVVEVLVETNSVESTNDSCHPNSRTVTFCSSLNTLAARKRVQTGSPHINKKYSISSVPKFNIVNQLYRHDPVSPKASSSPDLESLQRNSAIDCDADESSIGSTCSKCSTSSNGDDDVFYPESNSVIKKESNTLNKSADRPRRYRNETRKGDPHTLVTMFLSDDPQNDSGVSTSSANELSVQSGQVFIFPPDKNIPLKAEDEDDHVTNSTSSDCENKSLSQEIEMSTDTCVWDSDEQTLDTYV